MNQHLLIAEVLQRRAARRNVIKFAASAAAVAAGSAMLSGCGDDGGANASPLTGATTVSPSPPAAAQVLGDADILNFALNLEYLEAQFYSFATTGAGLPQNLLGGTGTQGAVTGGRKVAFTDPQVSLYANEIAQDEAAHVAFLRTALNSSAIAQPAIDVSVSPTSAFSMAAISAGLITQGQVFDPYANDINFLLGAFIFEDVGVTAYKGASPLLKSATYLEAAAGILAAEAYHAGLLRTALYARGLQTPSIIASANAISAARDSLDGPSNDDVGIQVNGTSNIVPTDSNALAFSRNTGQVLDIVFLTKLAATKGGFFPNGVNGAINTSQAN